MNMPSDGNSPAPRQIVSIRETADELGVSERTIYRMLRAGKLVRIKRRVANVNSVSDNQCQSGSTERDHGVNTVSKSSKLSDNSTGRELEMLRAALHDKDAQIEQLIANQREMNQTIQRLQEQMFELARLVLSQSAPSPTRQTGASVPSEKEKPVDWRRWLALFRPGSDKTDRHRDDT